MTLKEHFEKSHPWYAKHHPYLIDSFIADCKQWLVENRPKSVEATDEIAVDNFIEELLKDLDCSKQKEAKQP